MASAWGHIAQPRFDGIVRRDAEADGRVWIY